MDDVLAGIISIVFVVFLVLVGFVLGSKHRSEVLCPLAIEAVVMNQEHITYGEFRQLQELNCENYYGN